MKTEMDDDTLGQMRGWREAAKLGSRWGAEVQWRGGDLPVSCSVSGTSFF